VCNRYFSLATLLDVTSMRSDDGMVSTSDYLLVYFLQFFISDEGAIILTVKVVYYITLDVHIQAHLQSIGSSVVIYIERRLQLSLIYDILTDK